PFRAVRPPPGAAVGRAAVPYDVVSTEEARRLAGGNTVSFLHVSRAEIVVAPVVDPHADEVYATARRNFDRLIAEAPLVREERPSLYFYRLHMGGHVQTGLAAAYSVDEYDRDLIRKHERARADKDNDRPRPILELR